MLWFESLTPREAYCGEVNLCSSSGSGSGSGRGRGVMMNIQMILSVENTNRPTHVASLRRRKGYKRCGQIRSSLECSCDRMSEGEHVHSINCLMKQNAETPIQQRSSYATLLICLCET